MQQQYMQQFYPAYTLPPPFPGYMQTQDPLESRLHYERLRALLLQKDKAIQHLKEKEYLHMVDTAMFNLVIGSIAFMDWWSCFLLLNENRNY
jgi:hypothetical protein